MASSTSIKKVKVSDLIPYANNSRTHSDEQVLQIASSIKEFGFLNPVIIDADNGIIAGHGRAMAAKKLGIDELPCIDASHLTEAQKKAYIIADNKLALNAGWDDEILRIEFDALKELDFDLELTGFSLDEIDGLEIDTIEDESATETEAGGKGSLADRFGVSPMTVLNAREGWWQSRKQSWLKLGIKSEVGRDAESNAKASTFKGSAQSKSEVMNAGVSIFDPVLCELAYTWFSPVGGVILDPFAGGSVRGVVASKLGRQYIGHELRPEQVAANRQQGNDICSDDVTPPAWIDGDSRNIDKTCHDVEADFVFSCPPYADLEVYSNNPQDISTLDYSDFKQAYFEIIKKACDRLKNDRFACFVVGEVRDKKGNYYDFVGDTVQAFRDAGLEYYNEAILVTPVGTVGMQTSRNFPIGRKFGKVHQNVLIFVKGDGKKAAKACGDVVVHIQEESLES